MDSIHHRQALKIVTYNVRQRAKQLEDAGHMDAVLSVLTALDPDVVSLQEVLHPASDSHLVRWADALSMEYAFTRCTIRSGLRYGNAILSALPIRATRSRPLPSSRLSEPRRLLGVVTGAGSRSLTVWGTHLGLLPADRARQTQFIVDTIQRDESDIQILAGDMNIWRNTSRAARVLEGYFGARAVGRTFPAMWPALEFDRVYVEPGEARVRAEVVHNGMTRRASDHLPLVATVGLRSEIRQEE